MPDYKPWSFADKHAYRQKQASRFTQNARAGDDQKSLSGWMVSDTPETTKVYGLNKARQVDAGFGGTPTPTARPVQQKGSGGGGFLGGLAKITSGARSVVGDLGGAAADAARFRNPLDELGGAGKTVLEGFDKPRKYVGAPALGIATGALGGRVDEQGQRHGGYGLKEWGKGIVAGLKDPMAAGQAVEDISRTYPLIGRAAAATASDPLSFVGPGLASKAVKAAGMGGRAGAVAAGLLDSGGGGVALGGRVGSEADIEYGAKIPGWNKLSPEARQLIAGVLGGVAGGHAVNVGKQALKGEGPLRGMGGSIVEETNPHLEKYMESLTKHGVEARFGDDGSLHVTDRRAALEVAKQLEMEAAQNIEGTAIPGGSGGVNPHHYGSAEWDAREAQRRADAEAGKGRNRGAHATRTLPGGDAEDFRALEDAERIREVTMLGRVDPAKEAERTPLPEGSRLANHEPLPDDQRAALEEAAPNRTKGNAVASNEANRALGEDDAVRFINDRIAEGGTPRDVAVAVGSEIDARGFTIGRKTQNLSVRERAFRAKLQELADEVYTRGHDATRVDEPGAGNAAVGAEPGQPIVESVPGAQGATGGDQTVKRVGLDGTVTDTFQTEAELNGVRATQGDLFGRGEAEAKRAAFEEPAPNPAEVRPTATTPNFTNAGGVDVKAGDTLRIKYRGGIERTVTVTGKTGESGINFDGAPGYHDLRNVEGYEIVRKAETHSAPEVEIGIEPLPETGVARVTGEETGSNSNPPPESGETGPKFQSEEPKAEQAPPEEPKGPPPPIDRSSPHATLGLDPNGTYTPDEIRAAYRAQARRYHPDLNDSPTATADMQTVNDAFERLMGTHSSAHSQDPGARSSAREERRQANEEARQRRQERQNPPPGGGPSGPATEDWYSAFGTTPPGTPPPGSTTPKGPTFKHFGQDDRYDLFGAQSRAEQVRRQETWLNSKKGQFAQAIRRMAAAVGGEKLDRNLLLDTLVRPFVVGEKNRTQNIINHWTAWIREEAETKAKRAGLNVAKAEDGAWRINGDAAMPTIEDVIERSTPEGKAFYDALSPEQRTAIDFIEWANEATNKTILAHAGNLPFDPDIKGTYFPRKVQGIDGKERTSGASSFRKSRTMESLEQGIAGKVEYDNPWDAFEAGMRGKLNHAQDSYMVEMLKPLAVKPDAAKGIRAGFGYDYVDHPAFQQHPMAKPLLFPQDVADRINAALKPQSDNIFTKVPKGLNSVLTPLRATGDLSASMQQGMAAWLRNPKRAAEQWMATVASLKDPEVYFKAVDKLEQQGPGFNEHIRWGGHYTSPHSTDDFLLPNISRKISGGKLDEIPLLGKIGQKSNEHFSRFLNLTRFDEGNRKFALAKKMGLEGAQLDAHMREAWNGINRASGWSGRAPTTMEKIGVFAPRYLSASVEQVAAAVSKGGIEGSIARQHLARLAATSAALAWMINSARGYETEFDPRSSNFLRIRNVGGLDVSIAGTYDTLIRAVAGVAGGKAGEPLHPDITRLVKFGESKMSPAVKLLYEPFLKGETYLGEPLDPSTPGGFAKAAWQQAKSSLPFNVQDAIEEGPLAGLTGSTGLSARLMTPTEKLNAERDRLANQKFGKPYGDLAGEQKSVVNEQAKVASIQSEKDAQDKRRGGDSARRVEIRDQFQSRMSANAKFLAAGKDDTGSAFSGNDYRDAYHEMQTYLAGMRSTLAPSGKNDDVSKWFDLYDQAQMANGQLNFEKLDTLQGSFRLAHPGIDAKVDAVTGIHDDQTLREYRQAQGMARQYYAIPAYRGLTKDQADKAQEVLSTASGLVKAGRAMNTKQALSMLMASNPDGVTWARIAQRAGANPARKQFRQAHPEFGRFYTEAVAL